MGYFDFLNGVNPILDEAEELFKKGYYEEALKQSSKLSKVQELCISKEQFLRLIYISAKCFYELNKYESALNMIDIIINYPDYNHQYISRAEALKKKIQN